MEADKLIVVGDVHGCIHTLLDLIDKVPRTLPIMFVGDLIDRGLNSKEVVSLVIKSPRMNSVMGNHEMMLLNYFDNVDRYSWLVHNGGANTLLSYSEDRYIGNMIPDKHMIFFRGMDLISYPVEGLAVSHSHVDIHQTLEDAIDSFNILWNRGTANNIPGRFHVFGHTPNREPIITDIYANIDTGCVFGGKLTAIAFPSKTLYQVNFNKKDENQWTGLDF